MDNDAEELRIREFTDIGNYHAAINLSLSAMNENRRNAYQPGVDRFIALIKSIVEKIENEFGSAG